MSHLAVLSDLSASRYSFSVYVETYQARVGEALRRYKVQSWAGVPNDREAARMTQRILRDLWPTPPVVKINLDEPIWSIAKQLCLRRLKHFDCWLGDRVVCHSEEEQTAAYAEAARAADLYIMNSLPRRTPQQTPQPV